MGAIKMMMKGITVRCDISLFLNELLRPMIVARVTVSRPRNESKEEKKVRKQAVKQERQVGKS